MIQLKEKMNHRFITLYEGTGGSRYWGNISSMVSIINLIMDRGARIGTALYILCTTSGQSVYLSIAEQKEMSNKRKLGGQAAAYNQFSELVHRLGLEWNPMYLAYIHYHMHKKKHTWTAPAEFIQQYKDANGPEAIEEKDADSTAGQSAS